MSTPVEIGYACPECHAGPGEPCRLSPRSVRAGKQFHMERRYAAGTAQRPAIQPRSSGWTPAPGEWDAVPCPTCQAPAGQPCTPPLREGTTADPRRIDAAMEAKRHRFYTPL